jgi:hypothetical protein
LNLGPISWQADALLKEQCQEIFYFWFFHESSSPKPLKITFGPFFKFFQKFVEIFTSQGAPLVSTTLVTNFPPVSMTTAANFATSSVCVVDTGSKFLMVSMIPAANNTFKGQCQEIFFSGSWRKLIHEKTEVKNLVALSL